MSITSQLDGSQENLDVPVDVKFIYQQSQAPNISVARRVDLAIRSSQLNDLFNNRYPVIVNGGDLVSIIEQEHARTFFSEWFCNQNLPNILRNLVRLDRAKILQHTQSAKQQGELNSTFTNLLDGQAVIRNSLLTDILKEVALALKSELGLPYSRIYRICFVLALTPNQRAIHFGSIPVHQDLEVHSMLVDLVRHRLVEKLLEHHEN